LLAAALDADSPTESQDVLSQRGKAFGHWLKIEREATRDLMLQGYREWLERQLKLGTGKLSFTFANITPSNQAHRYSSIVEAFRRNGVSQEELGVKNLQFSARRSDNCRASRATISPMISASVGNDFKVGEGLDADTPHLP
jgi:hypothetical protein